MESKHQFYSSLEDEINKLHPKKRDNYVIDAAKYEDILSTLRLNKGEACEKGGHFKQWVLQNFNLVKIGTMDYVYSNDGNVPIVKKEEIFDIISR